ncbi:MAG: THxN family PEP-CTERM protein [Betaproteobacteria bacterium]|nr:THxN family PEP-CTERM protein [Betaproteobacteria bacterium]
MKRGTISKLIATSALAFAASASQAASVDTWEYTLNLEWVVDSVVFNAATNPLPGYVGDGAKSKTVLSWGKTGANYKNVDMNSGYNRSALEISVPQAHGTINTDGVSVEANMFTHYNSPIYDTYPTLAHAQLAVTVNLGLPGSANVFNLQRTFEVYFKETPNTGEQCAWGLCDDDIFAILTVSPTLNDFSDSFVFNGYEYTFNYFETSNFLKPLSAAACNEAGVPGGFACYGFTTPEAAATTVNFAFSMTATAVPEPETYAMLLAGLGMIGVVARRRRNAIRR